MNCAFPADLVFLLVRTGLVGSNSEARRMIQQGGVRVNGRQTSYVQQKFSSPGELVLQVGKRRFARVLLK